MQSIAMHWHPGVNHFWTNLWKILKGVQWTPFNIYHKFGLHLSIYISWPLHENHKTWNPNLWNVLLWHFMTSRAVGCTPLGAWSNVPFITGRACQHYIWDFPLHFSIHCCIQQRSGIFTFCVICQSSRPQGPSAQENDNFFTVKFQEVYHWKMTTTKNN